MISKYFGRSVILTHVLAFGGDGLEISPPTPIMLLFIQLASTVELSAMVYE